MKKILIIGYVWPEPNSSAAGHRMMQLLSFCQAKHWQITFTSPAQPTNHMADLSALGINVVAIKLNCQSFDEFIEQLQPDVVLFDRFMMEEQFGWRVEKQCPTAIRLLDTEDLFCLRHARHDAFKQQRVMTNADLLTSDLAKREVAAILRCDLTLMISHVEMKLLQDVFNVSADLLHYCPFMFTEQQLTVVNPIYSQRQNFISIGNFRHPPNWDAVVWLKQQIWPLIRKQLPQAKLLVYGAYPPPKATALHDEKIGFLVKGWVDDATLAMQSARVCLAPLRFGAGIKGKLAQAMLSGTPSVTTPVGAESMNSEQAWGGAVVTKVEDIVNAAVNLYQTEEHWQLASDNGLINSRLMYQEQPHIDALSQVLARLESNIVQHRQMNFTGAMLRHHSHRSTQYMAQWIEVKNKLGEIKDSPLEK